MADEKDKKIDNSIIESQVKQESLTGEDASNESSTFGKFDNKYVKGAIAAIIAAYAAKKDPYMLKGFSEKVDELAKADRANRSKYIEASATGIGKVLAENAARRKERITDFSDKINQLTVYTKDKYTAASMIKSGLYSQMLAKGAAGTDINSLFKVTTEYDGDKGNLTTAQLAQLLAGPTQRLDEKFTQFNAPRKFNPVGAFIGGSDKEDVTSEVMSQTKALAPEAYADGDVENIITDANLAGSLTDRGKRFFQKAPKGDFSANATRNAITLAIIKSLGGEQKIQPTPTGPVYVYDSTIKGRVQTANQMTLDVSAKINELMNLEQFDRAKATSIVIGAKIKDDKDPLYKISQKYSLDLANPDSDYEPIRKALGKKSTTNQSSSSVSQVNIKSNQAKNLVKNTANVISKLVDKYNLDKKKYITYKKSGSGYNKKVVDRQLIINQKTYISQGVAALTKPNQMFEGKSAEARAYVMKQLGL